MFDRLKIKRRRGRIIQEDRRYLEARVRRFLSSYQSATDTQKTRFYDVVVGASAGCHPEHVVSHLENPRVAEITAEAASAVVRRRIRDNGTGHLSSFIPTAHLEGFITDAYATAAVACRHAAGVYVDDECMQSLGTEAVQFLTMATSRRMAKSRDGCPPWQRLAQSVAEPSFENG